MLSHGGKASARAVVNASPEPVSNVIVSSGEDIATLSLLALAIANPLISIGVAIVALAFSILMLLAARRLLRKLFGSGKKPKPG